MIPSNCFFSFAKKLFFISVSGLLFISINSCSSPETLSPITERVDPDYDFDTELAISRFSSAIQFATVAVEDTTQIEYDIYDDFITFIQESYPYINEHLKLTMIGGYTMLYKWEGSNSDLKPAAFIGHYDAVPVESGTEDSWTHPPFSGAVEDGFIWGRGAMDDKAGVMSVMEAAEHLLKTGFQPERTFYIALNHDEEIGGLGGALAVSRYLESKGVRLEFLMDEGSPVAENIIDGIDVPLAMIGVAKKGAVNLEFIYRQDGGHSSMPPQVSVIGTLSDAVRRIENNPMRASYRGLIKQTFEPLIPYMSYWQRRAFNNTWLFRRTIERRLSENPATNAALRTTGAVSIFEAGIKENVLPVEGRFVVNFRIHPNDSVQDVIDYARRTIKNPEIEIRVMPRQREPSRVSDINAPQFRMVEKSVREVFEDAVVVPSLFIAGSDSRHFHNIVDNIYRFRPIRATHGDRGRIHGIDERVRDYNYLEIIQFQIQIMKNGSVPIE